MRYCRGAYFLRASSLKSAKRGGVPARVGVAVGAEFRPAPLRAHRLHAVGAHRSFALGAGRRLRRAGQVRISLVRRWREARTAVRWGGGARRAGWPACRPRAGSEFADGLGKFGDRLFVPSPTEFDRDAGPCRQRVRTSERQIEGSWQSLEGNFARASDPPFRDTVVWSSRRMRSIAPSTKSGNFPPRLADAVRTPATRLRSTSRAFRSAARAIREPDSSASARASDACAIIAENHKL